MIDNRLSQSCDVIDPLLDQLDHRNPSSSRSGSITSTQLKESRLSNDESVSEKCVSLGLAKLLNVTLEQT